MGQLHFESLLQRAQQELQDAMPDAARMQFVSAYSPLGVFPRTRPEALRLAVKLRRLHAENQQQLVALVRERRVFCVDHTSGEKRYTFNPQELYG